MTDPTLSLDSDVGDLTAYGLRPRYVIRRGGGPQQFGFVAEAGKLDNCLLDNFSRDLDPLYTPGPFFGNLRRKIEVQAAVTWGATTYSMFVGRADDIPQSYPNEGTEQYVPLTATDLFDFLNVTPINMVRPAELTGTRIAAVLAAIDYPGASDIDPGMSMVCAQDLQTVSALSHLGDCAQVEYGELGINSTGVLYFRDRNSIATDGRSVSTNAGYVQDAGQLAFVGIARGSLPIINHVTLTYGKDGLQVTVRNQDSIDAFDLQATSVSLPFETYAQAWSYGMWLLWLYSDPQDTFLSVTFEPVGEPSDGVDLWRELLTRQEGDLIDITLEPTVDGELAGEPIQRFQWWRGAEYDFDAGRVAVAVQDAWTDGLFYWDDSELDGPDFYGL